MDVTIKIKRIPRDDGSLPEMPKYATNGSAAVDLRCFEKEKIIIAPGESVLIPTGLAVELPEGYAAFVFARSGLAIKQGLALSNGVGVIDSDYRGEIKVGLVNLSSETRTVNPGDRIAQMAIMPVPNVTVTEADELSDTERGEGGFGSTGRH